MRMSCAGQLVGLAIWSWGAAAPTLLTSNPACAQSSDGISAAVALEQALTQIIEQTEPSVVSIGFFRWSPTDLIDRVDQLRGDQNDVLGPRDALPNQFSTGVIIADGPETERFVLTAYHAVRGGPVADVKSNERTRLEVCLHSRHRCSATIYAADPRCDLAVLRLNYRELGLAPLDLRPVSWSVGTPVRKGQLVVTLGNPYWVARDGSASAAWGMVANVGRRPAMLEPEQGQPSLHGLGGFVQLDHRLPIGSSGSPVVNLKGELVGISSSAAAIDGFERSGGFAIPIEPATRWIIQSLVLGQEVEYGFLGIRPSQKSVPIGQLGVTNIRQPTAVRVQDVHRGSPAQLAGVLPEDKILAVNGEPVLTDLDLMRAVTLHPPESTVRLSIWREARPSDKRTAELTVPVKLGKWPVVDGEGIIATRRRHPLWRGLGVDYSSARWNFQKDQVVLSGVLVVDVAAESASHRARLQPGEFIVKVNRSPVRTPAEFTEAVKSASGEVTLWLYTGENSPPRSVVVGE